MKRLLKFGSFSDNSICMVIFITSFILIYRYLYIRGFGFSPMSTDSQRFKFYAYIYYIQYFEPIVILIWLKFVCEFLFNLLKRN